MKRIALLSLVCLCVLFGVDSWRRGLSVAHAAGPALANSDCLACHNDPQLTREVNGQVASLHVNDRAFAGSVHGSLNCTSCHADIKQLPHGAAQPVACGSCHMDASEAYSHGLHAKAIRSGEHRAAICLDCHGGPHQIQRSSTAGAPTNHRNIAETCGHCHGEKFVMEGTGLTARPFLSYQESVHGHAVAQGNGKAATCTDCHSHHDIRPPGDAASPIFKLNVPKTCGQCHPGASDQFIQGKIHLDGAVTARDIGSVATGYVRWIYLSLIFLTIGGMLLHNGLIWRKKLAAHRRATERAIVRMTGQQRAQHWLLLTSFFVLVLTGFALKYPGSWLGVAFGASETLRRVLHRAAAVVMLGVGFYHLGYIALSRDGRKSLFDMLPRLKDARDVMQNLRYLLGRTSARPQFARFGYAEKVEYWALIWGTFIMGLTGLMIWFKLEWFSFAPHWLIDVATAVHFYEAILATAAIIVWHFYHVIFDPDVYPLNLAMVDGRVSAHWYREEHELDYERLMRGNRDNAAPTGKSPLAEPEHNKGSGYDTAPAPSEGD